MKNKTFIDSVRCAFSGLAAALKTEKNFYLYGWIALTAFVLNWIFNIDTYWWLGYIVTVSGVISAELINTSIERLADILTNERKDEIKAVKDIAAAGVLFWGFGFFTVEIIALGSKIL